MNSATKDSVVPDRRVHGARRPRATTSVTIERRSEEDFKQRQLVVWLDGEKLGELMFGEMFTRDVRPNSHKLRVSNTLVWKTVEFKVTPGEQVRFEAINRAGHFTYPLLVTLGVGPLYVTLRRVA